MDSGDSVTADLVAILRPVVNLAVRPNWRTFARPGPFDPVGIIVHHTGGQNDLNTVIAGRPDLAGPLANLYSDRDEPWTFTLISGGRCNHAGEGAALVLGEVRLDVAPSGDALARGLSDGPGGNGWFYGIEAENLGDGRQPWPVPQLEGVARACAAICAHHGWSANRVIAHREWTRRKPDPRGIFMPSMRARVAALLRHPSGPTVVPGPIYEDAAMQPHFVSLHAAGAHLDGQGNGYWDLPQFPFDTVVTVNPNVANPPELGRYNVPDVGFLRWRTGIRVVAEEAIAGGGLDVVVWTAGPA